MSAETVRAIISLIVIGFFVVIGSFIAIYPMMTGVSAESNGFTEHFQSFASLYTGIVGTIIGYYFGRPDSKSL